MRYSVKWPMCPVCFVLDFKEAQLDETTVFCKCENGHTWAEPVTNDEENEKITT